MTIVGSGQSGIERNLDSQKKKKKKKKKKKFRTSPITFLSLFVFDISAIHELPVLLFFSTHLSFSTSQSTGHLMFLSPLRCSVSDPLRQRVCVFCSSYPTSSTIWSRLYSTESQQTVLQGSESIVTPPTSEGDRNDNSKNKSKSFTSRSRPYKVRPFSIHLHTFITDSVLARNR